MMESNRLVEFHSSTFVVKIIVHGEHGEQIGRAFVYIIQNELHDAPYAFMEYIFVEEPARDQNLGSGLVARVISVARDHGCYKIVAISSDTSLRVHSLYESLGFDRQGDSFRMNL